MSFNDYSVTPADDPQSTSQADLDAAAAGALASQDAVVPVDPEPVQPFGSSWLFDWANGQFVRVGQSPMPVSEVNALAEWAQMAIRTGRYAHPVFSDEFGVDEPDSVVGEFARGEALADWQRELVEALMVHDRVTSVENVTLDWDPTTGILTVLSLDIVTDEDTTVTVSDVTLQAGGA
jgi:hypothetical protein